MAGFAERLTQAQTRADDAFALGERILEVLEDMRGQQGGTERVQYVRRPLHIELDATGAGSAALQRKAGVDLELISYAGVASAASTGGILFFMDQTQDPTTFFAVGSISRYFSDGFQEGDRIVAGRDLMVVVQDGPPNGWVTVNISGRALVKPAQPIHADWSGDQ